jgi:hypothetical protein
VAVSPKARADVITPMLLQRTDRLAEDAGQ